MKAQFISVLYNIFVMSLISVLGMLVYSFRSNGTDFNVACWLKTSKNRLMVGAILIFGLSILMVVEPDISGFLSVLGFDAGKTPVALGMAICALLVSTVPGNCVHDWKFFRNIYGDEITYSNFNRSVWRCEKCGKTEGRAELYKTDTTANG